jgi:hypothetical protein
LVAEDLRRELCELLAPGGQLLGEPTRPKSKVRRIRKEVEEARALFAKLEHLGHDDPTPTLNGRRVKLPGVGHASYREVSKTGPPTIDIRFNISGLENIKFKFVGRDGT